MKESYDRISIIYFMLYFSPLTHISLASFLLDVGKKCRLRPDAAAQSAASGQGLHFLLAECSIKILIKMKNTTQHPLNQKWTVPIDNGGKFHSA